METASSCFIKRQDDASTMGETASSRFVKRQDDASTMVETASSCFIKRQDDASTMVETASSRFVRGQDDASTLSGETLLLKQADEDVCNPLWKKLQHSQPKSATLLGVR